MKIRSRDVILALLSGILTSLSFPKFNLSFLVWISFIPLFFALRGKNVKQSFLIGLIGGFSHYSILIYWIPSVPVHYGNVPLALSLLIFLFFVSILALFWCAFSSLFTFISSFSSKLSYVSAPFIWVSIEYILTYFLTGFPWCLLGYSQFKNLYLIQLASITGVYGISFLIVLFTSSFVFSIKEKTRKPFLIAVFILLIVYGSGYLSIKRGFEKNKRLRVGIIQGNVQADIKWEELSTNEIINIFQKHLELTRKTSEKGAELVIWPEFTVPLCLSCPEPIQSYFKKNLIKLAKKEKIFILIGSIELKREKGNTNYYNSTLLISENGILSEYSKIHLVPFGEYIPFKEILFFVEKISHAIGELSPGKEIALHKMKNYEFGSPICYEIIFPNLVRKFVKKGAKFLATITNDGWYGKSSAPYQHFSMAVLRAVENRKYLLRSATTGISGVIDPFGRIIKKSNLMTETFIVADIYPLKEKTFYTKYGDWFPILCITITLLFFAFGILFRKLFKSN